MKIKLFFIYGLVAGAVSTSQAQTVLPLDPAVRTGKLANGFTYYIRHNEEPKNRVQNSNVKSWWFFISIKFG